MHGGAQADPHDRVVEIDRRRVADRVQSPREALDAGGRTLKPARRLIAQKAAGQDARRTSGMAA
jgi:hypothetical protein